MRKRFGQHFLHDAHVIQEIVNAIQPSPQDMMVEIGPGLGALTTELLPLVKTMDAIELDRDLIPQLEKNCRTLGTLHIHQQDALNFDFSQLTRQAHHLRVVGNLPYNISTPLIFHLLDYKTLIQDMHFMLQKEVVDRITAQPGEHAYGRLSVMVQYACSVEYLLTVDATSFHPPPKVTSAVVRLSPFTEPPFIANDLPHLSTLVKQAFSQRRKMLHNTLKGLVSSEQIVAADIDPNIRAEEISVKEFVRLSNMTSSPK